MKSRKSLKTFMTLVALGFSPLPAQADGSPDATGVKASFDSATFTVQTSDPKVVQLLMNGSDPGTKATTATDSAGSPPKSHRHQGKKANPSFGSAPLFCSRLFSLDIKP